MTQQHQTIRNEDGRILVLPEEIDVRGKPYFSTLLRGDERTMEEIRSWATPELLPTKHIPFGDLCRDDPCLPYHKHGEIGRTVPLSLNSGVSISTIQNIISSIEP